MKPKRIPVETRIWLIAAAAGLDVGKVLDLRAADFDQAVKAAWQRRLS